jgi:primosomal replication protein N''
MIRFCPSCRSERSLGEVACGGLVEGQLCGWDLSDVPIRPAGSGALPAQTVPRAVPAHNTCSNGHSLSPGDIVCVECGLEPQTATPATPPPVEDQAVDPAADLARAETIIDGWRLVRRLNGSSSVRERFIAESSEGGRRFVLTLYRAGSEPDSAVYDVLRSLPRDHVPEIAATGRWEDRPYEVAEDIGGGSLADLEIAPGDLDSVKRIADEIGRALHAFSEAGLRHRDLQPSAILVRTKEPLDLVITDFGSARLSDFDLDIVSPLETSRFMAPEAIAGGVAAASDWWSLGMILLERVTQGRCFDGVNEQAFLIHVLSNGVPIPSEIDPSVATLLRGLLARDRAIRWQWTEVRAWLNGEAVDAPEGSLSEQDATAGPQLRLGDREFRKPSTFALAAAEAAHWDEARNHLLRGALATWLEEAGCNARVVAAVRQITQQEGLVDDSRLSIALKILNPAMPLIERGNIITPGWLLDHSLAGYELITGPAPDVLARMDAEIWLSRLKVRATNVRARASALDVKLNEEELRVQLLSTSQARLAALWADRRRLFPDTEHSGLLSILDRRQTTDEDLILLLGASVSQFRSVDDILEEAGGTAERAGVTSYDANEARLLLEQPRREIYRAIDARLNGFARCGLARVDEWADQFRLERRMQLGRALALLAVPRERWMEPPKQQYVSTILDFFAKKVAGAVLRGPLVRMTIGKATPRVDIFELGTLQSGAPAILDHLLARSDTIIRIDPDAFAAHEPLERRLRALYRHSTLYKRDTGIDGLYLGFPFLLMQETKANTRPRIAPILLWPIRIIPEVGSAGQVSISFDRDREEVRVNPAFEGLLGLDETKRWREIAHDLLGRASISTGAVMDAFGVFATARGRSLAPLPARDLAVSPSRSELACAAVLFHVAYSGQAIVEDLRQMKAIPPEGTGLETALRISAELPQPPSTPTVQEINRFFTVPSDPSQEAAVLSARSAPGLLVEGPPGTGKSQTIVNMIGDSIGRRKSLLVVCQKQAALEVVRKRLEAEGLANRFVMVVDVNRDREPIIRSIREQLDQLFAGPAGGAPSWRRKREQLAAQIEAVEGELDRHHGAIHRLDDKTGCTYRILLGELVALEQGTAPIDVSGLRSVLSELDPARLARVEEECAPLSRSWLAAKYEGSPLRVLTAFSSDQATINAFSASLGEFAAVETQRLETLRTSTAPFELDDPEPYLIWQKLHEVTLLSMPESARQQLSQWLHLFRPNHEGVAPGPSTIRSLSSVVGQLASIEITTYDPLLSPILARIDDASMRKWVLVAAATSPPSSFLSRISPRRLIKRRRLRTFLAQYGQEATSDRAKAFVDAVCLEEALRPLRRLLQQCLPLLGVPATSLAEISAHGLQLLVRQKLRELSAVADIVKAIDECPRTEDAEAAAVVGTSAAFEALFAGFVASLARHEARAKSRIALERLELWFEGSWISDRRTCIDCNGSNDPAISHIQAALPTIAFYQRFRLRVAELDPVTIDAFRVLREKASYLEALAPDNVEREVRRVLRREARLAWKTRLEQSDTALLYERGEIENKIRVLESADTEIRVLNRDLIREGVDGSSVRPLREWEDITRLRGQRARRLREFIDLGADRGLMALRPVWLMSPDVASRVLPLRAGAFDTVIYDEASQIPVEYALPTLFRGKVAIVSGDDKQMPPTSFFSSKVESDEVDVFDGDAPEDDASEEERDSFQEAWNRREIKDCPDLLNLAKVVLPTSTLQIHYRSEYRELIGFSNASFYGNRLNVPVRHPDSEVLRAKPIEVIRADGVYKEQSNEGESAAVTEILARFWATPKEERPSIGVVTFNRKQADLIDETIEARAEIDPTFRAAYAEERERIEDGEDMSFFVKNVENVQGDERDIIVFSSTFGRNAQGTFRRNFGVLGQKGGERRLNVAVTRARKKIVMVTSMPIAEISDMLSTRQAPARPRDYLQGYLEYARAVSAGEFDAARAILRRLMTEKTVSNHSAAIESDGIADAVSSFVRELGYVPEPVHDDGAFGLDFAIVDVRTGLYGIGIECDAPRHGILSRARAREIWRPQVLRRAIPMLHRVSSHGWYHMPDEEKGLLKAAISASLG